MNKFRILIILNSILFIKVIAQTDPNLSTQINKNETTTIDNNLKENDENNKINNEGNSENFINIRLPQSSTLQKFQRLGRTLIIPSATESNISHWEEETLSNNADNSSETEENWINITLSSPYPIPTTKIYNISDDSGNGIELFIRKLDIHPTKDYLKITLDPSDNDTVNENKAIIISSRPLIFTGLLKEPLKLRAVSCTNIKVEFKALERDEEDSSKVYDGFFISYRPFGEKIPPPTMPPDVTVPFDELETIIKSLVVERDKQNNETWLNMKTLLCNATNQYLNMSTEIDYFEPCYPENVTFTTIIHCPQNWPESSNCIQLYLAIQLYLNYNSITTIDPFQFTKLPREPGGLNKTSLANMWDKSGRNIFEQAGYPEYVKPSRNDQLLLWLSIGVGIILIIFIIAVTVLKSGIFKNKWVALEEDDKKEFKNPNDIDITMYPSPDQVVPELFPGHPNVYGNEIGYNIDNSRIPSISETRISRDIESTQMIEEGINPAYIEDEDERVGSVFRMRLNGVNRDEINT